MFFRAAVLALAIVACAGEKSVQFEITTVPQNLNGPGAALCSPCIQLGEQGLNVLLNYILNAGVIGGCSELCGHLPSPPEKTACTLVCGAVGLKGFIAALNRTDLDPFYFCEELHACSPGPDDAHVDLVSAEVSPDTISRKDLDPDFGGQGVDVQGALTVNVSKASGPGEWSVSVHGPVSGTDGPIGSSFLLADGLKEGLQTLGVKLHIVDKDADPSDPSSMPVTWNAGDYTFNFHVCQGECGSKHPHSKDFGKASGSFSISKTVSGAITI